MSKHRIGREETYKKGYKAEWAGDEEDLNPRKNTNKVLEKRLQRMLHSKRFDVQEFEDLDAYEG